jgi:hypothetical protein
VEQELTACFDEVLPFVAKKPCNMVTKVTTVLRQVVETFRGLQHSENAEEAKWRNAVEK